MQPLLFGLVVDQTAVRTLPTPKTTKKEPLGTRSHRPNFLERTTTTLPLLLMLLLLGYRRAMPMGTLTKLVGWQEKENGIISGGNGGGDSNGRDRWVEQDKHKLNRNHNYNRKQANGVLLDADGNVDYVGALSSKSNSTERGGRSYGGLFGGHGEMQSGVSGRLVVDRPGFPLSALRGADKVSGELLGLRKKFQEIDDQEEKQVCCVVASLFVWLCVCVMCAVCSTLLIASLDAPAVAAVAVL